MLAVNNLSVAYGESRTLRDISLVVPDGQVVCIMGRNGMGKTTLLKAIMGILRARPGRIEWDGADMTTWAPAQRARAGIGYVPQGRGIFPYLTVYENLLMGFEAVPKQRVDLLVIEEMYQLFPVLKEMRKRTAGTLSGGQQQQLAIARALVRRPKLLLLDEPTEGIQPSIMLEIEALIVTLRQQQQMAILLVEQFLDFARSVADRFYLLETGKIVAQGPMQEWSETLVQEYLGV